MGLDMYLYKCKRTRPDKDDPGACHPDMRSGKPEQIAYWRKHPNLHGLIESIYVEEKHGKYIDNFNCINVELTENDINNIISRIKSNMLPHTTGFFFGASDGSEREEDLAIFNAALDEIRDGYKIYYSSWW